MESCSFVSEDSRGRCGSRFNCREVEFRHPSYRDLNVRIYLCQSHFMTIFGQSVAVKDSKLPLEEEKWLELMVRNEDSHYRVKLADTKKLVRDGIGSDFDWATWYANNLRTLEDLKSRLKILRRSQCRFEWCKQRITDFKKMYTIRVYPRTQTDYVNLVFCCLDHWEVYKKRIGLATLKGKLDQTKKKASFTLDSFAPEKVVADI